MNPAVTISRHGDIAVVTIDNPPVNALSAAIRVGVFNAFKALKHDDSVAAVVLACAGRTFVAGADISEFGADTFDGDLNEVCPYIEQLGKPVVAALHGTALGGGLELALGCHYRIATRTTRLGLPEVTLGLLPGGGGCQRVPRLIGVAEALDFMIAGVPITAAEALGKGMIDAVVEGDLNHEALVFARKLVADKAPLNQASAKPIDPASYAPSLFADRRAELGKKARGTFAPLKIVDCIEAVVTLPFADAVLLERKLFLECMHSPQSTALRHAFFAEREAGKILGLAKDVVLRTVRKIGIIGAGTMGGGIAMNFVNAGLPVVLLEVKPDALERGVGVIRKNYETTASKGRMTLEQVEQRMALLTGSLDYADLADCDLVIEAVF